MNTVYIADISNYSKDEADKYREWLSHERKERLDRFRRQEDYMRSLIGDVMVRSLFGIITGRPPYEAEILYGRHKKPYFSGGKPFFFNISHSGRYVVCAVSESPCGVDIEEIASADRLLVESVCSDNEKKYLLSFTDGDYDREFFRLWTLKESYVKYVGEGLYMELKSVSFADDSCKLINRNEDKDLFFFSDFFPEGYVLSVCGNGKFRVENFDAEHNTKYQE